MKIIDGKDGVLGRIASYVAKELLQGEEVALVNCDKIIITGDRLFTEAEFIKKRSRVGRMQRGPRHIRTSEKIVKRTIRGMLPNYREGRGREAWKRIKCYSGIPKEFEGKKMIEMKAEIKNKYARVEEFKH